MSKQKKVLGKHGAKIFIGLLAFFAWCFFAPSSQALTSGWSISNYTGLGLSSSSISDIITNIAKWLLSIFGFIAIIGFVISGIIYLVSSGDEDGQARAKRAMIYSITGVVVALAGLVIIYAVSNIISVSSTI